MILVGNRKVVWEGRSREASPLSRFNVSYILKDIAVTRLRPISFVAAWTSTLYAAGLAMLPLRRPTYMPR